MRRAILGVLVLALAASVAGCSWARRAKHHRAHARRDAGTAVVDARPDLGVPPLGDAHPIPPLHSARVVTATAVTLDTGRTLDAGGRLLAGQWVDVAEGGALVLDYTIDTRVEVEGGSRVRIGNARPAELWIAHGAARGLLSPGPTGARAPLHLGTPEMAVEIPGNGDAFVAVLADAPTTMVFVLSGAVELHSGVLGSQGRPATRELHPAQEASNDLTLPGVTNIDEARARVAGVRVGHGHPRPTALDPALERVDTALTDLEAEDAARHALLAQQPPPPGSDAARERLARLIEAGQRQLWKRIALLAAWERAQATAGSLTLDASVPLVERDPRVRAVLGNDD